MIRFRKGKTFSLLCDLSLEGKMLSLLYDMYLERKNVVGGVQYVPISSKFYFTTYFIIGTSFNKIKMFSKYFISINSLTFSKIQCCIVAPYIVLSRGVLPASTRDVKLYICKRMRLVAREHRWHFRSTS